jgi:hypothetical protein
VNGHIDEAPLINCALGISIRFDSLCVPLHFFKQLVCRGAGLTRYNGGTFGFWKVFEEHYKRALGGEILFQCNARKVSNRLAS